MPTSALLNAFQLDVYGEVKVFSREQTTPADRFIRETGVSWPTWRDIHM